MDTSSTIAFLEKLKCSKCHKFLSYFPIYSDPNQNSICGRCQPSESKNFRRNNIFEISMEHFKFPCCYESNGCSVKLIPKRILEHENWCEFRTFKCSALSFITEPVCDWKGFASDIYEHFEQKHQDLILQDGKFEVDLISNYTGNFLYAFGEYYFIVTKTIDSNRDWFACTLTYIGSDPIVNGYKFRIILGNGNGSQNIKVFGEIGGTIEIKCTNLLDSLGNPCLVLAEIDVFEKQKITQTSKGVERIGPTVNYEMIEGMKCSACSAYMLPPIFQCETGHCVCSDCKIKIKACPSCTRGFNITQNFALAQVINYMIYPCKNEGCSVSRISTDIRKHESTCVFRPITCPVHNYNMHCIGKATSLNIREHLLTCHHELVLETDELSCLVFGDKPLLWKECNIVVHDEKIFLLHHMRRQYFDNYAMLSWALQLVGTEEESKNYKFEIDIPDNLEKNCRIYMKGKCKFLDIKKVNDEELDLDYMFVNYRQIETYLNDNLLYYRIRIIEEKL